MDSATLIEIGRIAGIGGIALGVLLIIFRDVIRKAIYPTLTRDQAYKTIRLILIFPFIIAVLGIAAWVFTSTMASKSSPQTGYDETHWTIAGLVKDTQGNAIVDADIYIVGGTEGTKSTSTGRFNFTVTGEKRKVRLMASKQGYLPWNDDIDLPNTTLIIQLKSSMTDSAGSTSSGKGVNPIADDSNANIASRTSNKARGGQKNQRDETEDILLGRKKKPIEK